MLLLIIAWVILFVVIIYDLFYIDLRKRIVLIEESLPKTRDAKKTKKQIQ
jgi:hypothetical protein